MTLSLRQFARSRRLRAMGVLAWLMLVINSLAAAPMGMTGMPHAHPMHATAAVSGPAVIGPTVIGHVQQVVPMAATASGGASHADCCSDPGTRHCASAAICAAALAPMAVVALTPLATTTIYAMPLRLSPPSLATAPPLRPPAA